jgi:hypothetical protein
MPLMAALQAYAQAHGFQPPALHPILDQAKVMGLPVRTKFSGECLLSKIIPELERDLTEGHRRQAMGNLTTPRY